MSFIIRAAFWLTVLAFLLPTAKNATVAQVPTTGAAKPANLTDEPVNPEMDTGEMLKLASRSAQDVMGFCDRNHEVCAQGGAIVGHVATQTTFYGGKLLSWLTEQAKSEISGDAHPADAPQSREIPAARSRPV